VLTFFQRVVLIFIIDKSDVLDAENQRMRQWHDMLHQEASSGMHQQQQLAARQPAGINSSNLVDLYYIQYCSISCDVSNFCLS
jgi:hypothetical protein